MPLQSKLLSGDPKLEACLVSDPDHVTPGSHGDHVAKIQTALNELADARLKVDGIYGSATAKAVTDYKNAPNRRILQSYQTSADNIVGKRTIASLDSEMLALEKPQGPLQIVALAPTVTRPAVAMPAYQRSSLRLAFKMPVGLADLVKAPTVIDPTQPTQSIRMKPRDVAQLLVKNPGGNMTVRCVNIPAAKGDCPEKICWLWLSDVPSTDRLVPDPTGFPKTDTDKTNGGERFFLFRKEDVTFNLDAFNVGDATVTATNGAGQQSVLQVSVRAESAGPVKRPPLTKLAAGSKFFSARWDQGGEFDPHNIGLGRPVNPNRGGRLINLGGEQETPEFEDYQVNLGFSGYKKDFTGNKFIFRPLYNDTDKNVAVGKKASHICIRGNPFTDEFRDAIKDIAMSGCLFTFAGGPAHLAKVKQELGGTILEENAAQGQIVIRLP